MRVVVAEPEALLREGLVRILKDRAVDVPAAAADGDGLLAAAREHQPDLVLADAENADLLAAVLALRRARPELAVAVLTRKVHRAAAAGLLVGGRAGVGYLLRHRVADGDALRDDLARIAEGAVVVDPDVLRAVVPGADPQPTTQLTGRQREVLGLLAEGLSNAAIATKLAITPKAVVEHVSNVYDALGLAPHPDQHRRVLAVLRHLDR